MNFTKQDIIKIAAELNRIGVRDTQFSGTSVVDDTTIVPVVQNGVNKIVTMSQVAGHALSKFSVEDMPIAIDGVEGTTLLQVLNSLKSLIGEHQYTGDEIFAGDVKINNGSLILGDTQYNNVQDLLTAIIACIETINNTLGGKLNTAENSDITNLFNR